MGNRGNKPTKIPSEIRDYLLNYPECSKHYNVNKFAILSKGRNIYYSSVLESPLKEIYKPKLFKQKFVFYTNLYKLL